MNADGTSCNWWNGHRWAKWQDITTFQRLPLLKCATDGDDVIAGSFIVQHRRCDKCGELQSRRVEQ